MMNDDDKDLDKTLNRLMIGGAVLVGLSVLAGTYDAGYQAGSKEETKAPITVHGNVTINNHSNNSSQPLPLVK